MTALSPPWAAFEDDVATMAATAKILINVMDVPPLVAQPKRGVG